MYMLIAAVLAISLLITAAPAQEVRGASNDVNAEWTRVSTPTTDGWVLAPEAVIYDYALADGGDVAYAVVEAYDEDYANYGYRLLKSDDGAATWDDITDALEDADDGATIFSLLQVATDWEDPDFVAVAVREAGELRVYISDDGGDTFEDAGEVVDGSVYLDKNKVSDLAVSYEDDGEREIAIGGQDTTGNAALFRCTVDGDNPGAWKDATDHAGDYQGWDDDETGDFSGNPSALVTDIIFSPSWETDRTILVVTATNTSAVKNCGYYSGTFYLQSGVWGETSAAWNEYADFAEAVPVKEDVDIPYWLMSYDARAIAGVTLPMDYSGADTDMRYSWVWVNYYDVSLNKSQGEIFRVRDDSVDAVDTQISKMPWLTNVSYLGYKAEGKAIAGLLAESDLGYLCASDLIKECCEGVQVYRNAGITSMEICCLEWDKACKPPTGRFSMAVSYVSDDKAYAVALGGVFDYEEGAWSVSFDDGDTWNQLSLVDTYIDYLSDVAVSPDCNKTMLVSVHEGTDCDECDSVWLYAENLPEAPEYSGYWLRTWNGQLEYDWGFLRLAPEETTGDTVYLVDYDTNTIYYNDLETLACWDRGTATVDEIVDLAVKDESTIFALDYYGDVAMSDDHGAALTWTEPVDSKVDDNGYTIAVWGDHVLVGGEDGDVSYSEDFDAEDDDTFTELDEPTPIDGWVTVAFDSYFDQNDVIYAAVDGWTGSETEGGIYLWVVGESEDWTDIDACHELAYTGLVLDNADGNPMTSPETGGVLYASYVYWHESSSYGMTGVARCLTPIVEICCDVGEAEWDYLYVTEYDTLSDTLFESDDSEQVVGLAATPDALKICGCLTPDSNSHLFAIDEWASYYDGYDMDEAEWGTVWMFEDCYAKKGVELVSPVDGFVVPADPCECDNIPFTIKWDRVCDSCCYEFEFALDEDFTEPVSVEHWYSTWYEEMIAWIIEMIEEPDGEDMCCMDCCYLGAYCPSAPTTPSMWVPSDETFTCEFTYYWKVRAVAAETGQCIRSWWSEPQSFTVAPAVGSAAINLVSPEPGATDVAIEGLGFSWGLLASADAFDWVLDNNSDLSSPVESKTGLTDTAYGCTKTLEYDTTYYWQVTAYNEGAAISMSDVGTFRTVPETVTPPEKPVETPFWVWVVIVIGAVLVIVVIVLIFRTRRV